jgi:hypothetical protein
VRGNSGFGVPRMCDVCHEPTAAIDAPDRKRFFNRRRQRDPLGGAIREKQVRTRLLERVRMIRAKKPLRLVRVLGHR